MVEILEGRSTNSRLIRIPQRPTLGGRTWLNGLATNSSSPASAMVPARNLQKLSRDLDVVVSILQNLHASFTGVKLSPGISIQFVLFAGVTGL